jgi:ABC-2 type transport system ATP-binding protein
LYGVKDYKEKIMEIAKELELTEWLNQYVGNYSKGMKLKLALARILIINPKILFLDEPMLGLDPKSVKVMTNVLKALKKTIFITSHQMNIVQKLCDRIAFLRKGAILKLDSKENFSKLVSEKIKIVLKLKESRNELISLLNKTPFISALNDNQEDLSFYVDNEESFPLLFHILKDFKITFFKPKRPSLEDVFIKLSS